MDSGSSKAVLTWRWAVFLLALGYFIYEMLSSDWSAFGGKFRYLTIWGLTANLIVAAKMLRLSLGRTTRGWNSFVSAVVVLNIMVVFLYWKLYFQDPALVNGKDGPGPWWQEYYLHLGTQVLMWIDAFFILGVFRRPLRAWIAAMAIFLAYIGWIEFLVAPLNSFPEGTATHGLPYPFLNDMDEVARALFYAQTLVTATVFFLIAWGIARGLGRFRQAGAVDGA